MNLNTAQLGSGANIGLGGYIPAPAQRTSLLQQALASFLGGAATNLASRGIDMVMPSAEQQLNEKALAESVRSHGANETLATKTEADQHAISDRLTRLEESMNLHKISAVDAGTKLTGAQTVGVSNQNAMDYFSMPAKVGQEFNKLDLGNSQAKLGRQAVRDAPLDSASKRGLEAAQTTKLGSDTRQNDDISLGMENTQEQMDRMNTAHQMGVQPNQIERGPDKKWRLVLGNAVPPGGSDPGVGKIDMSTGALGLAADRQELQPGVQQDPRLATLNVPAFQLNDPKIRALRDAAIERGLLKPVYGLDPQAAKPDGPDTPAGFEPTFGGY